MASAKREPITEVWDSAPGQRVSRPEVEGFLALDCPQEGQNLRILGILQTVHNSKKSLNEKES